MDKTIRNVWFLWAAIIDGKNFPATLDAIHYLMNDKKMTRNEAIEFLFKLPVDNISEFDWMIRNQE